MRRAIIYTTGTQLAIQAIGLVTGIIVARILGPTGRGQLAAVVSWPSMLAYLGNLGLPVAFTFAAARFPAQRHQLFGNGFSVAMVQWLVLGVLGLVILPFALASQGEQAVHLAALYLWLYLPLNLLTLYANAIQQGSGRYGAYNAVRVSVPLSYAAGLGVLWLLASFTVTHVVFANLVSNVIALALALATALPSLIRLRRASDARWNSGAALRRDLRYGVIAQVGALQVFSGLRLDLLVLTVLVSAHELGLYAVALSAANVLRAQGYALGQVALPEIAKRHRRSEQWRIIGRLVLPAAGGTVAAGLVVIFAAKPLLRAIYGGAFVAAAPALVVLTFAGGVGAIYRVVADGLRGMGRPGIPTATEIVALAMGVPILVFGASSAGATGAAAAVLVISGASLLVVLSISALQGPPGRARTRDDNLPSGERR